MQEFIKLRRQVDGLYQVTRDISRFDPDNIIFSSNELIDAFSSLRYVGSWIGEIMRIMNLPAHQKVDITAWKEKMNWDSLNRVQRVNLLMERIDDMKENISLGWALDAEKFMKKEDYSYFIICFSKVHEYLIEARFNLGYEIDRINGH